MIDKSNKKFQDKFAKLYAPFMKKDKEVYDKVCEYLSPHLNKDMEVLELACGSGSSAIAIYRLNRNFIGVELEEKYAKLANMRVEDEKTSY